jgi:hypothetical protein
LVFGLSHNKTTSYNNHKHHPGLEPSPKPPRNDVVSSLDRRACLLKQPFDAQKVKEPIDGLTPAIVYPSRREGLRSTGTICNFADPQHEHNETVHIAKTQSAVFHNNDTMARVNIYGINGSFTESMFIINSITHEDTSSVITK